MPNYTIDLRTRFGAAFGESLGRLAENVLGFGYKVPVPNQQPAQKQSAFVVTQTIDEDEPEYYSALGTPIYDRVIFQVNGTNYEFALPPLIDLRSDKRVSITTINDNDFDTDNLTGGEVVESWGNSPFDITFRGILVDMINHQRPYDQLTELLNVFKENAIIQAVSRKFLAAGIRNIFITSIDLPEGDFVDTLPFIINARSYVPAELILND
jgi:hypothetical protein